MRVVSLKTGLLVAVLSVFLSACSSTSTQEEVVEDTGMDASSVSAGDVATGTVTSRDLSGADMVGDVDTVFYFDLTNRSSNPRPGQR